MQNNLIMPSVLLSIDPYYSHKILIREKLIEVRKNKPNIATPFKCYIYCTKGKLALLRDDKDESERYKFEHYPRVHFHEQCGRTLLNGKVIGEFVCDKIFEYEYFGADCSVGINEGYAITDCTKLNINDCLTNGERLAYGKGKPLFGWHISDLVIYDKPKELSGFIKNYCSYFDPAACDCTCRDECCYQYRCMDRYEPDQITVTCADPEKCITRVIRPPQSWCYVEGNFCGFFNLKKRYVERKEFFEL